MKQPTLQQLQQQVDEWINTKGVRYFSALTNLGILQEEVGELARHIVRQHGEQSYRDGHEAGAAAIADELADVLWVVLCMANQLDIDLSSAMADNMHKKTTRDGERHLRNPKLKEN